MAFGLKYELLCTTIKGNLYKAKVYFDGYAGSPIDRNVPLSPFILKKDKADIIRGTSFNFSIREEVDFEFLEFYTNNNKAVKIELYDPSNVLIWTGYNLPQQYQVPYVPCPTNVTFSASDGLGLLKNEAFALTGRNSQLDIIRYCIDKIGLALGYSIAINLFEVTHDHSRTPLAQTYEDSEIFTDLNCYEVIEKILINYNAEITQRRGRWAITRSADKKSTRMLYTSAGVYETTEAAPVILNLGYPGSGIDVTPKSSLQFSLEPGGKQVKISHNFGRKDSLLINPDFSDFASGAFNGWGKLGTFTPEQRLDSNGNPFVFIPANNDTNDCLYQDIEIEASAGEDFDISLEMGVLAYRLYGGIPIPIPVDIKFNVALIPVGGTLANAKFLSKDGWVDTLTAVITTVTSQSTGIPKLNKLEIITHEIPFSGTLQVTLYRIQTTQLYNYFFTGVAFGNVDLKFITADGKLYPTGLETLAEFPDSTEPNNLDDIDLLAADAPDLPNARLLYKNITWLSDGSPTGTWHILGSSADYSILQQLALSLASDNRVARQKLTGEIKGIVIAFDSIIKHSYNNNREFEISEGEWDIYEETFNVTLLELLAWSDEEVTFSSVNDSTSSGGSSSGSGVSSSSSTPISPDLANMATLAPYFELVNPGETNEYLRVKLAMACDYDIQAYSDFNQFPSTIWADMPVASASVLGGIKVGTGLTIDSNGVLNAAAGVVGAGTWGSITGNIGDQVDLTSALATKLNSSSYTAADVLSKLLTVDGGGSGLDAAFLEGHPASYFAAAGGSSFVSSILYGGSSANDDITIRGTSNTTRTSSYVILADVGAGVLVGTTSMSNGYFVDINGNLHVTGNIIATGEITAFSSGAAPGDWAVPVDGITMAWDGTPKSLKINASVTGNASKFLRVNSGETGVEWVTVSASMVYPGAGIPLSTSSAWGTSITDNSANWNTAYGWGNHASAGYVTGTPWTSMGYVTGTPWTSMGYLTSQTYPAAGIALSTGSAWGTSITNNSSDWNAAYGWGNHADMGYATYPYDSGIVVTTGSSWDTSIPLVNIPIFSSEITGTPDGTTYLRGDGSWQMINGVGASISGTPVVNQLAIWTDSTTIKGDTGLTYSGTLFKISGDIQTDTSNTNTKLGIGTKGGTGTYNTAIGNYAFASASASASYNVGIGYRALQRTTTGASNVAMGGEALSYNLEGGFNVAIGRYALTINTSGNDNIAIGAQALYSNIINHYNVAIGFWALCAATASFNISIGYQNSKSLTTGQKNVVIGSQAGYYQTTGDYNVIIGENAAYTPAVISNSVVIGRSATVNATGETNEIVIGYSATGNGSNTVTLGNTSIIGTYLQGTVYTQASSTTRAGLNIPHGAAPTTPANGDIWTTTAGIYIRINGATVGPLT
jgi:hypothetical protein